jgi:hypothetical protein
LEDRHLSMQETAVFQAEQALQTKNMVKDIMLGHGSGGEGGISQLVRLNTYFKVL